MSSWMEMSSWMDVSSCMDSSSWWMAMDGCQKVSADMDMSSPSHPPAQSHGRLVRIWISVLVGHELLNGYEFLVDVSTGTDMSSPPHPPAQSHGRWGGEGPLRTTGGHFLRHQPICHWF